jgi:hypothetical protein
MIDYLKQENIKYNFIDSTVSIATRKHPGLITFNIWSDDNNAEKHMLALNQMSRFGPTKYAMRNIPQVVLVVFRVVRKFNLAKRTCFKFARACTDNL